MTLQQVLIEEMDEQAGDALVAAVRDGDFITTQFPHERVTMQCGEERVTASVTDAIYEWNGQQTAMALFEEKNIISKELLHHIYWEGLGKVKVEDVRWYRADSHNSKSFRRGFSFGNTHLLVPSNLSIIEGSTVRPSDSRMSDLENTFLYCRTIFSISSWSIYHIPILINE